MAKIKKIEIEEVKTQPVKEVITEVEANLGNESLNNIANKLNEVIRKINAF